MTSAIRRSPLRIDVWSSVECPWCYIGKRRLESAIATHDGDVEVTYHSFFAAPPLPSTFSGTPVDGAVEHGGYSRDVAERTFADIPRRAAAEGIDFHYDRIRQTDTAPADQLIHHAHRHGIQERMVERLLHAYSVEGRDLGDLEALVDIAAELQMERADTLDALRHDRYTDAVEADRNRATEYGIGGVPFFIIDGRYALSGAQESTVFAEAMALAEQERS